MKHRDRRRPRPRRHRRGRRAHSNTAQNDFGWKRSTEATAYQSQGSQLVDDNAPAYPFNP